MRGPVRRSPGWQREADLRGLAGPGHGLLEGQARPVYAPVVMRSLRVFSVAAALAWFPACGGDEPPPEDFEIPGVQVQMRFGAGFYDAPFPGEHRRKADGRPDASGFPDPESNKLLGRVLSILDRDVDGFGVTSGVFFSLTGELRESLGDPTSTTAADAQVFLINVDAASPERGRRHPVDVQFRVDGGPFGAPNLLSVLPLQGVPLRPKTTYATVVLRGLLDARQQPLGVARSMGQLARGQRPEGLSDAAFASYQQGLRALAELGTPSERIAGLSVFTTGDPARNLSSVYEAARARPTPAPLAPFAPAEQFADFCVFSTTIKMPSYQAGELPFEEEGGGWAFDAQGKPQLQREEEANFVATVPRRAMPEKGYPIVIFSRTGGGGERPLVDRGKRALPGGAAVEPGTGPALEFARVGWGGMSIDGPHGGLRNVTKSDEQFSMFNVTNPEALRDNVRQSAVELALATHILDGVVIDTTSCPGAGQGGQARFDTSMIALMGHSMGATIAPLSLAIEPRLRAGLLSGAGGSWIENVVHKKKPLSVRPFMEILLGVSGDLTLHPHDPALSLFQWAGEAADPPVYGRAILDDAVEPRHILMMQGMVDHYILPSIANATSLSLGLDLGGEALDEQTPEVASFRPLRGLLPLVERGAIGLPAAGNRTTRAGARVTAVVTQHREDGIEDGHEVVFQTPGPKHQLRCFLAGLAKGSPAVPPPAAEEASCP